MDKRRMLLGAVVLTLLGLAIGYVLATIYFAVQFGYSTSSFDLTLLARNWLGLRTSAPQDFLWVNGIILGTGLAALLLTATMLGDALTRFGTTHWQSRAEMKRNGFFAGPGGGFLLGKMGPPKSKKPFIVSRTFPHALVVAPTGRGKGVGFVIPNLLTYRGSAVVLDVKGENFRETSRFRASTGDKVFRFAPTDWERPTHRYNPLARIAALKNPDRQQMELKLTAKLFLQTENEKLSGDALLRMLTGAAGYEFDALLERGRAADIGAIITGNKRLAQALAINGTPAFVFKDEIVGGMMMADRLSTAFDRRASAGSE